jgi:hypothetical protein
MMKINTVLSIFLSTVILCGCTTFDTSHVSIDASSISTQDCISVFISDRDADRTEIVTGYGSRVWRDWKFMSGPIWKQVFTGSKNSSTVLEIKSTHLWTTAGLVLFNTHYKAEVILTYKKHQYPITAESSGGSGLGNINLIPVVEVTVNVAQQVKNIMNSVD